MKTQQAIKEMFPEQEQAELSSIWNLVFDSELSAIFGKPSFDPTKLDECLKKQYSEYKSKDISLKDFITKKFGEKVYLAIR